MVNVPSIFIGYIILRTNFVDAEVKIVIYFSFARPLWSTHGRGSGCWRWKCVNQYGVTCGNIDIWLTVDIQSKVTLKSQRTGESYKIRLKNLNVLVRNIKKIFSPDDPFLHANYNWNNYSAKKDILVQKPAFSTCSYPRKRFFKSMDQNITFIHRASNHGLVTCSQSCNICTKRAYNYCY